MLRSRREYTRREPQKSAKKVYIFCEGTRREDAYFSFFKELSSRINVKIYPLLAEGESNNPRGLFRIAEKCFGTNNDNEYEFIENLDEVWFVIDTDQWGTQITELKTLCNTKTDWYVAQSNPCFEVWLYYHFQAEKPAFEGCDISSEWKSFLNKTVKGGFDSRKHPNFIVIAIQNASKNYSESDGAPDVATTQVFRLGNLIYSLTSENLTT